MHSQSLPDLCSSCTTRPGVGAILVSLNTRLAPPEYAYILEHSGSSVVFAAETLREQLA